MKITRTLDATRWRQFVDEQPTGNIFHTPEMFQVFVEADGHRPELWAVSNDDSSQILALLLPVKVALTDNLLLRYVTTRSVVYGSVLCFPSAEGRQGLELLLRTYTQETGRTTLFTELRNLSDLVCVQTIFDDVGFVYEDHLNYLIDLQQPVDEIWKRVKSDVRTNVRKARNKDVVIVEASTIDEIKKAYAILKKVYQRIQVPLAAASLFESAFRVLHPRDMFRCFLAQVDGVCIGAAFRLCYKDVIYAWYAGIDKTFTSYKAQDLLNWHVLEWGAENGYKVFDFGGAGKPQEEYGPRRYKAKYRGDLVNYGRNVYVHSPALLKLSKLSYHFYRRYLLNRLRSHPK